LFRRRRWVFRIRSSTLANFSSTFFRGGSVGRTDITSGRCHRCAFVFVYAKMRELDCYYSVVTNGFKSTCLTLGDILISVHVRGTHTICPMKCPICKTAHAGTNESRIALVRFVSKRRDWPRLSRVHWLKAELSPLVESSCTPRIATQQTTPTPPSFAFPLHQCQALPDLRPPSPRPRAERVDLRTSIACAHLCSRLLVMPAMDRCSPAIPSHRGSTGFSQTPWHADVPA